MTQVQQPSSSPARSSKRTSRRSDRPPRSSATSVRTSATSVRSSGSAGGKLANVSAKLRHVHGKLRHFHRKLRHLRGKLQGAGSKLEAPEPPEAPESRPEAPGPSSHTLGMQHPPPDTTPESPSRSRGKIGAVGIWTSPLPVSDPAPPGYDCSIERRALLECVRDGPIGSGPGNIPPRQDLPCGTACVRVFLASWGSRGAQLTDRRRRFASTKAPTLHRSAATPLSSMADACRTARPDPLSWAVQLALDRLKHSCNADPSVLTPGT